MADARLRSSTSVHLPAVDVAKAIGIVLVVFGHSPGMPALAVVLIFSFHMPLFFFLSGMLHGASRGTPAEVIRRKARTLLVPYLFFFCLSLAYWLATRNLGDRARKFEGVTVTDAIHGLFTGRSSDLFVNEPLWFLPCLFVCTALYVLLRRRLAPLTILGCALAVVAAWNWTDGWATRLPWGLDIAWVAMIFYAAGDALRNSRWTLSSWPPRQVAMMLPLVLLVWLMAALRLGRVDLARANFGDSLGLYLATALLGIAMVLMVSRLVPSNAVLRWLSEHTLIIFPLHGLLMNFASGALKFMHLRDDWTDSHAWALVFFAWAMLACLPAAALLTRRFPYLLGRRPTALNP